MPSFARAAVVAFAVSALAACGTTVPGSGAAAVSGDGLGLSPGGGPSAGALTTSTGQITGSGTTALSSATGNGSGTTLIPRTGATTSAGTSATTNEPHALRRSAPITIGIPYADSSQSNAVLGSIGQGLAGADVKQVWNLLIGDLNTRGGIRGHKIQPVYYQINLTSNVAAEEAAACESFTHDHHVLVAVGDSSPGFARCVTKGGSALIDSSFTDGVSAQYNGLSYVYQPGGIAQDHLMAVYGKVLDEMGYFTSTTPITLGVMYEDTPAYTQAEQILERSLTSLGIKVKVKEAFAPVQSEGDVSRNQSQVQAAVLKFRSAGVTHVIAVENNAWLIGFFGVGAASQGYYPRYGYDSNEVLSNVATNVPARALEGSVFLGYYPPYDTLDTSKFTPAGRACLALLHRKGYNPPTTGNGYHDVLTACDDLRFLGAGLDAAPVGMGVSRSALAAGVQTLGTSYSSAVTFQTRFTTGLGFVDGVSGYRKGKWDDGCSCFAYTSGNIPFSR
ncbi:MAG: hypothetical protein JWO22_3792 [Frankiales bacterium]|nr:hypothetical protein [Frankiales bacterium]